MTLQLNCLICFNQILHFYIPWKLPKIHRFSEVLKGYRNGTLGWNWLKIEAVTLGKEAVHRCSTEELFWKNSHSLQENNCDGVFISKAAAFGMQLY